MQPQQQYELPEPAVSLFRARDREFAAARRSFSYFHVSSDTENSRHVYGDGSSLTQCVASVSNDVIAVASARPQETAEIELWAIDENFEAAPRTKCQSQPGHNFTVGGQVLALAAQGFSLLAVEDEGNVALFDVGESAAVQTFSGLSSSRNLAAAMHPQARQFATGHEKGVSLWDPRQHRPVELTLEIPEDKQFLRPRCLQYNPVSPCLLACGRDDGSVVVLDSRGGESRRPLALVKPAHTHAVSSVAWLPPHDDLLLSGGFDGVVRLWQPLLAAEPLQTAKFERVVKQLMWHEGVCVGLVGASAAMRLAAVC